MSLLLFPQIPKQLNRCRSMSGVVVVSEGKQLPNLLAGHHFFEDVDPLFQIALTVNNDFVPSLRLLLDGLAVPEPSNIGPVSRCQIQVVLHFPRSGHPTLVNQG